MGVKADTRFLEQVVENMLGHPDVSGVGLCVSSDSRDVSWRGEAGNIREGDRYFITSVSKLCASAVVLQMRTQNRIRLADPIGNYLPHDMIYGLHVLDGIDYSGRITVGHLLANTSGIPDYLSVKRASGRTADAELSQGNDESWTWEKVQGSVKQQKPGFAPGKRGKAHYSNTNYRLLGAILERITEKPIHELFKETILDGLNLQNTYVFQDTKDTTPVPMYHIKRKSAYRTACLP